VSRVLRRQLEDGSLLPRTSMESTEQAGSRWLIPAKIDQPVVPSMSAPRGTPPAVARQAAVCIQKSTVAYYLVPSTYPLPYMSPTGCWCWCLCMGCCQLAESTDRAKRCCGGVSGLFIVLLPNESALQYVQATASRLGVGCGDRPSSVGMRLPLAAPAPDPSSSCLTRQLQVIPSPVSLHYRS
jgi:hypothetical protein